jgi:phosphonate transport system substrate-binding protein
MKRRSFIESSALFGASLVGTQIISTLKNNWIEPAQAQLRELNFGVISTESQANQRPIWEPFIAALSKSIGIPVKAFYVTQYAAVIEAMRFGRVHIAWYVVHTQMMIFGKQVTRDPCILSWENGRICW